MKTILSLGAGVQSTTMALMAAHGEITPPDCAIFADTGWEPKAVYDHLAWLVKQLPFKVHTVSAGNLREDIAAQAAGQRRRFTAVPWFLVSKKGDGMGRRQCTKEYKLTPIRRKVRELLGGKTTKAGAEMWIGISMDEAIRMKPSQVGYIVNRWPLIEKSMSRRDCLSWLSKHGYSAPKSACIGCPFHNDAMWREMRDNDPVSWADAIAADRLIRQVGTNLRGRPFMHSQRVPLDQVDLSTLEDHGQLDLFNNECEGMCGV
jgi:hypothetical protein